MHGDWLMVEVAGFFRLTALLDPVFGEFLYKYENLKLLLKKLLKLMLIITA